MWRVFLIYCVAMALGLGGLVWTRQPSAEQVPSEEAVEQLLRQQAEELDLESEVESIFVQRCLVCHERASVDLQAQSISLAKWMHVIRWMGEKAPQIVSEEEAQKLRQEYVERIRQQLSQIEKNLETLRGLLGP